MRIPHYIMGIAASAIAGTLAGRLLFPPADAAAGAVSQKASSNEPISALPSTTIEHAASNAQTVLNRVIAARSSASPSRAELEATLMLRRLDDQALLALVKQIEGGEIRFTTYEMPFLAAVWRRYASLDAKGAFLAGLQLETRLLRENTAGVAARVWAGGDPAGALQYFLDQQGLPWYVTHHRNTAFRELARDNIEAALRHLEDGRTEEWYSSARSVVYEAWKVADSDAARTWLVEQIEGDPSSARDIVLTFSQSDPAHALDFALAMDPNDSLRDAVGEVIAGRWMWRDQDAAIEAFKGLPAEWLSTRSVENFGVNGVQRLDEETIASLAESIPSGKLRDHFWLGLASRQCSEGKFERAVETLGQMPENDTRADAFGRIASSWTLANPAAASEWIATLQPGAARDQAVARFAEELLPADPEAALKWADSIANPQFRERKLKNLRERREKIGGS